MRWLSNHPMGATRVTRAVIAIVVAAATWLCASPAAAQYDLTITTQVTGTVGNDLYSIADHMRVTLIPSPDGSANNVLTMHLVGDNGIDIRTPPGYQPDPLIRISTPLVLTGADPEVTDLFDPGVLIFQGMTQADYYDKGLPPGTYHVCIRSICSASVCGTQEIHSAPEPAGCSNTFEIQAAEPPYLLSPPCGEKITPQALQAVTFSWTPASGAPPATTTYTLEIVEMVDPDMAPEEALKSATTPMLFDQPVTGTSFFYGPSQPLFEPGRKYAWWVTAENNELKIPFANGGHSEACSFTWGDSTSTFRPPVVVTQSGGGGSVPTATKTTAHNMPNVPWSGVKGVLKYKFKPYGSAGAGGATGGGGGGGGMEVSAGAGQIGGTNKYNPEAKYYDKGYIDPTGSKALGGVRVSLVVTYRLLNGHIGALSANNEDEVVLSKAQLVKQGYSATDLDKTFPDMDEVVATTTTQSDGSFNFLFMQSFKTGVFDENMQEYIDNKNTSQGGLMDQITAERVTRTLRLVVDSPYYCSPDKDIVIQPWGNTDLGTLVSWVKTYRFQLTVVPNIFKKGQGTATIAGANVMILRKEPRNSEIPAEEGDPSTHRQIKIKKETYHVVDEAVTDPDGVVKFTRLVRPWNENDAYYYYTSTSKTKGSYNYNPRLDYYPTPITGNQHPMFNSEFSLAKEYQTTTYLWPGHPRVFGRVTDPTNKDTAVPGAMLVLHSLYKQSSGGAKPYRFTKSGSQGYFQFNGLDVVVNNKSGNPVGPDRWLEASKSGYSSYKKHVGILPWGVQKDLTSEVKLEPKGKVSGLVTDLETGAGVPAKVHFATGISVSTQALLWAQIFLVHAPSGKNQKLTVVPTDNDYAPKTFTVDIPDSKTTVNLGKFPVVRRRHRVRITVLRGANTRGLTLTMVPKLQPLAGASVELLGQVKKTDPRGLVTFVFDNQATVFKAKVTPPENADYMARYYQFSNRISTTAKDYQCVLAPAAHVSGVVTVGDSLPVDGARVYVDVGTGPDVLPIETVTAGGGKYTLRGIPLDPAEVTIHATRSSQTVTYVGDSKTVKVPTNQPVNLNLTVYNGMDITQLLGFPVEISSLVESAGGVTIDGSFVNLPGNSSFAPAEKDATLPFHGISLKPGSKVDTKGVPYAVPAKTPVETTVPKLNLRLFGAFDVDLLPEAEGDMIAVAPRSGGGGEIRGRAQLLASSFSFSANHLAPGTLFLSPPGGGSGTTVAAFTSDPAQVSTDSYPLRGTGTGGAVAYHLYGFAASAKAGGAYVRGDTLAINTTLHAEVGKSSPIALDIPAGWVRARPAAVMPLENPGAVSFNLEKWKVSATGWKLSAATNGILFDEAKINTGLLTVPAKGMHITPKDLEIDQANLKSISLAGVAPLEILTQNTGFGYDPKVGEDRKGHWKLSLLPDGTTPAAKLTGLPGMAKNASFTFESIDLLSDGEQQLGFGANAPTVTFYDVFKLVPGTMIAYSDYFQITGTVDLGVPRLSKSYQAILSFRKDDTGKIALKLTPIPFTFDAPGKVTFSAHEAKGAQTLGPDGFAAAGKLQSSEGIVLKTVLHRTTSKTWIDVEPSGQILPIGETKTTLAAVKGEMHVASATKDWTKFVFSGEMQGAKGMQGDTRKTFTIHGDITASGQGVDVKNIPTPFGDISITYDYPHGRMIGTLDINETFSGTTIVGTANLLVDGGGWYFLAGGNITISGFGNLKAGMLIGDYNSMPPAVASTLLEYAYDKHIPVSFQNGISGFFFTGRKNIPQFSIPDTGFDLGVVSAHLGGETGLDARVWMSFAGPGTELGIGAMGFVHAYFILSSVTCTTITGEVAAELGAKGILNTNGQFDLQGCASISLAGSLEQCIPTPSLDSGIVCKMCAGVSVRKSLKMTMSIGTSGSNASLGLGTCSGNEAGLSSGW